MFRKTTRQGRQQQILLREEVADKFVAGYINQQQLEAQERDDRLRLVLTATDKQKPEADEKFLNAIPEIHRSWSALIALCRYSHLMEMYALVMVRIFNNQIPFEVEKRYLALEDCGKDLVIVLTEAGQQWSTHAMTLIEKQLPKVYKVLFCEERDLGFFNN